MNLALLVELWEQLANFSATPTSPPFLFAVASFWQWDDGGKNKTKMQNRKKTRTQKMERRKILDSRVFQKVWTRQHPDKDLSTSASTERDTGLIEPEKNNSLRRRKHNLSEKHRKERMWEQINPRARYNKMWKNVEALWIAKK